MSTNEARSLSQMEVSSETHLGDRNGADLQLLPPRHHLKLHPRPERVPGQVHVVLAQERQTLRQTGSTSPST